MGSIHWPSNPDIGITKDTAFIQCVGGQEPQIHEVWILGLDGIIHEVRPKARVEVVSGTVRELVTDHLA